MSTHEDIIHQLVTLHDEAHPTDLLLSLYLPIGSKLARDLKIELHALILAHLRAYEASRDYPQAHQRIADYLTTRVMELDPLPKGIGLFARLEIEMIDQVMERDFTHHIQEIIVPFAIETTPQVFIGQVFDLRPLFQLDRKSVQAIVMLLDNTQGLLYQLVDDQLTKVKTIENVWSDLGEDEVHAVHSLGTAGSISQGNGLDSILRRQKSGNKMVLNMLIRELKPYLISESPWKQIALFAGPNFNDVLETWLPDLKKLTTIEPMVSNFIPGTEQQIIEKTTALIHQQQQEHLQQLYDQYQEEYHQWAKGWQAVTDAVRRRQVDTLLITPRAEHDGYILYNELPYTQPEAQSQHVHNLAPWLTKIVYQCNGAVIASNQLPNLYHETIVARLRYVPK